MKLKTPVLAVLALLTANVLALPATADAAEVKVHRVVIHVDENDPARMNLALNNAANIDAYYKERAEEAQIEIVAYGPGLHMLRADTSPVKDRIKSFGQNFDNIGFMACGNTKRNMGRNESKDVELLPQATVVPAGVVHLMERQEQGWSYVRP